MLLVKLLLPLLRNAPSLRVVNVLAAGLETADVPLNGLRFEEAGYGAVMKIVKGALTGTGLGGMAMRWLVRPVMKMVSFSPEEAGDRCLHLLISARYGGRGVPVGDGEGEGISVLGRAGPGALFLVDAKMNCLTQVKVFEELEKRSAGDMVWKHTMRVLGLYLNDAV
ncbi:hypothetical protein ACHAQH_009110 [Verticillium albo-atrum]